MTMHGTCDFMCLEADFIQYPAAVNRQKSCHRAQTPRQNGFRAGLSGRQRVYADRVCSSLTFSFLYNLLYLTNAATHIQLSGRRPAYRLPLPTTR